MDVTDNGDYVEAGMNMTPEDELKQRVFYASVRETIVRTSLFYKTEAFCLLLVFPPKISLLLVVVLYLLSYWVVAKYKRHRTREECYAGMEDAS